MIINYQFVLTDYPFIFWIILLGFMVIRLSIPIRSKSPYMHLPIQDSEIKEWRNSRTQNIMLASFSIVALALSAGILENNIPSLHSTFFYFAVSMFCFFGAAYLYNFLTDRPFPYIADTLEYTGIIAVAIGFLHLISGILPNIIIDILFLVGILTLAIGDLYINIAKIFYPKNKDGRKEGS